MSPEWWYRLYLLAARVAEVFDNFEAWLWRKKLAAERSFRRG